MMPDNRIKNKEMQADDGEERGRGNLVCVRECEILGVGYFKTGQPVTHNDHYILLKDHPFFTSQSQEVK